MFMAKSLWSVIGKNLPVAADYRPLCVVLKLDDIAVLNDVLLSFDAKLAGLLGLRGAAELDEVLVAYDVRLDEPLLDVGVE